MKLYYSAGACSLSPHIVLCEAGIDAELVAVDLKTKKTKAGEDFTAINPKGYVPVLKLDDGSVLTEGPAIVQYLADRAPGAKLAPVNGSIERYRLQEWLSFITSEIHKSFSPLFDPTTPGEVREAVTGRLGKRFDYVAQQIAGKQFLLGEFSVADAYLYTVLNWTNFVKMDLGKWPALKEYMGRVAARPGVQKALREEGLLK